MQYLSLYVKILEILMPIYIYNNDPQSVSQSALFVSQEK